MPYFKLSELLHWEVHFPLGKVFSGKCWVGFWRRKYNGCVVSNWVLENLELFCVKHFGPATIWILISFLKWYWTLATAMWQIKFAGDTAWTFKIFSWTTFLHHLSNCELSAKVILDIGEVKCEVMWCIENLKSTLNSLPCTCDHNTA